MKILLVHQNFPGQFLHLAPALVARGHEVTALTAQTNNRPSPVPVMKYRWEGTEGGEAKGLGAHYARATERGLRVARAAHVMRERNGYVPDVVFGHSGWGETLFLAEVWPEARHLSYAELMYRSTGLDTDFDPEFRKTDLNARLGTVGRTAHLAQATLQADAALSPTVFQADTFPPDLRGKIEVIHDGVDTARVRPDPAARLTLPDGTVLAPGDEVLSFINRSLEPYRGFHVFLRALPAVLEARPQARVVIIGDEGQSYGPRPADGQSWKQRLMAEVGDRLDLRRVHFLGRVPYGDFVSLMQVTRAHAYLTYPFVLSWSMIEAMAAGALVVGSRTAPIQEVIEDGVNGRLVDFFDIPGWSAALVAALADPDAAVPLREAARRTVLERYDLTTVSLPKLVRFVETAGAGRCAARAGRAP